MKKYALSLFVALVFGAQMSVAFADVATKVELLDEVGVVKYNLNKKYPKTKFDEINKTPIKGLYEMIMGKNVAYTDSEGNYFIFGHMMQMDKQIDLTAERKKALTKIAFNDLPFNQAIKFVQGSGLRKVALFADPTCGYCKKLEPELAKLDNVTVYLFLFPLGGKNGTGAEMAKQVWCAGDQKKAWRDYMILHTDLTAKPTCDNPIEKNVILGASFNIAGTPTLIREDGDLHSGYMPAEELDHYLDEK